MQLGVLGDPLEPFCPHFQAPCLQGELANCSFGINLGCSLEWRKAAAGSWVIR